MGIGSGIGGQVGIAAETTYGTFVAPTNFPEVLDAKLERRPKVVDGQGLAAGRLMNPSSRRVVVSADAGGTVKWEMASSNMGLWLDHIMGSSATLTEMTTTTAYELIAPFGDTYGKSLSIQVGVPDLEGVVHPYSYLGCKILDAEFDCEIEGILTCQATIDAQTEVETETLATATYPSTANVFSGNQLVLQVGPKGSEVQVDGVRKFNVKLARKMRTDRYYAGNLGLKEQPVSNGYVEITGSFDVDFIDKTKFADVFAAETPLSVIATWTGPEIGTSGHDETFELQLPCNYLTGQTPQLDGPDVVTGPFAFKAYIDPTGDSPATATWISADTTL